MVAYLAEDIRRILPVFGKVETLRALRQTGFFVLSLGFYFKKVNYGGAAIHAAGPHPSLLGATSFW